MDQKCPRLFNEMRILEKKQNKNPPKSVRCRVLYTGATRWLSPSAEPINTTGGASPSCCQTPARRGAWPSYRPRFSQKVQWTGRVHSATSDFPFWERSWLAGASVWSSGPSACTHTGRVCQHECLVDLLADSPEFRCVPPETGQKTPQDRPAISRTVPPSTLSDPTQAGILSLVCKYGARLSDSVDQVGKPQLTSPYIHNLFALLWVSNISIVVWC